MLLSYAPPFTTFIAFTRYPKISSDGAKRSAVSPSVARMHRQKNNVHARVISGLFEII